MSEFIWERLSIQDQRILLDTRWGSLYVEGDFEKPAADRLVNSGLMVSDVQGYYQLTEMGRALTPPLTTEQPPAAETGARGEVSDWGINPSVRELEAYGDGYAAGLLDGPEYAPLKNEIAALREQLAAAEAALKECVVQMVSHGNDDNWETLTMPYAEAINQARAALQATEA